ncbi:methyl-accepting chemotaxis protein [Curvibacter delicatus]|jgi:methyl-accepting chemotaxis protein|uniref:methyl-accepting chemotaxis protein n=1 Tax=Curvibacter delicatus TaxID=80879 RepID=UPI00082B05AD|nr:methyl-accepting chemotaxis protein [Curvibacter delicatus]
MKLTDIRIGTKLMGGFILVLCLAAAQTFYAVYSVGELNGNSSQIADQWLPGTVHTGALSTQASRLRAAQFQHVLTFGEDERRALEKDMDALQGSVAQEMQAYAALLQGEQGKKQFDAFAAEWKKYLAQKNEIVQLARQRRDEEALDILKGPALQTFEATMGQLKSLSQLAQQGAALARDQNAALQNQVMYGNLGALLVTVILGLSIARTLSRTIARGVNHAADVAGKVAQGDLSSPITVSGRDELGQLLTSLRDMQSGLAQVVARVRSGAESVATASAEIAQGDLNLSARTESQASSLEETAASMEELGSTVRQNADNAKQANQLAQSASTVAIQGGEVVAQVVDTMKGINDSSRKIADIISVIDGIAFQTNILALNAAVEAARAGEQGRGFAVVASEVRSLAGRSAEAAKEIKTLITDSVERVEQGSALVDRAGSTMSEVVSSIRRVTDIMGEISSASSEQSAGVAQIAEAVTQMDQTTQQNAALVEEIAAAASSLKNQADDLVNTVAVFQLQTS